MPHGRTLFKMVAGQVIGVGGLFLLVKTSYAPVRKKCTNHWGRFFLINNHWWRFFLIVILENSTTSNQTE